MKLLPDNLVSFKIYEAQSLKIKTVTFDKHKLLNTWKVGREYPKFYIQLHTTQKPRPTYIKTLQAIYEEFPHQPEINDVGPFYEIPEKEYRQLLTLGLNNPKAYITTTKRIHGLDTSNAQYPPVRSRYYESP